MTTFPPWRHNGRMLPWYVTFSETWGSRGEGRYWKRQLSKARRRAWRTELAGHRPRGLPDIESRVNWKNW
jgi:hypothetical protein